MSPAEALFEYAMSASRSGWVSLTFACGTQFVVRKAVEGQRLGTGMAQARDGHDIMFDVTALIAVMTLEP